MTPNNQYSCPPVTKTFRLGTRDCLVPQSYNPVPPSLLPSAQRLSLVIDPPNWISRSVIQTVWGPSLGLSSGTAPCFASLRSAQLDPGLSSQPTHPPIHWKSRSLIQKKEENIFAHQSPFYSSVSLVSARTQETGSGGKADPAQLRESNLFSSRLLSSRADDLSS